MVIKANRKHNCVATENYGYRKIFFAVKCSTEIAKTATVNALRTATVTKSLRANV